MARRVVDLHPEAITEGREARLWYRARSQSVEERSRVALRRAIGDIREAPERWPPDDDGLRYCRVPGFPYRLISRTDGDYSLVVATSGSFRVVGPGGCMRFQDRDRDQELVNPLSLKKPV